MCPEPGLLSAWVDGEVPSPWNERIEAHIAACPACSARVARYRSLSGLLGASGGIDEAAVVARIEARLGSRLHAGLDPAVVPVGSAAAAAGNEAPAQAGISPTSRARSRVGPMPVWRRSVPIPMPVAAAAIAVFVFLAGLAVSTFIRPTKSAVQSLAATEIAPSGIASNASIDSLVRYLETQNAQVNLTIQLPSGATFGSTGKPVIVKATDASLPPVMDTSDGVQGTGP